MAVPTWVEVVNKLATPCITAISALYVYLQYRRNQEWKATDLAQALLQKLDSDQALTLSCQALDWGVGPLIIPEQYRPLFTFDEHGKMQSVMQHDPEVLCIALRPFLEEATLQDPRGLVYRFCFIRLFSYFDNMFQLLSEGQLSVKDISAVKCWLEQLKNYDYAKVGIDGRTAFQPALHLWGFNKVISLGELLGVKDWFSANDAQQLPPADTNRASCR